MDFVDEEHVALLEVRQKPRQVAGLFDDRTTRALEAGAHRLGDDVRQRGFPKAGRAGEQDVIERFAALFGGGDGDLDPFAHLGLATEVGEQRRPQGQFEGRIRLGQHF